LGAYATGFDDAGGISVLGISKHLLSYALRFAWTG
jgi:hypothetical protein